MRPRGVPLAISERGVLSAHSDREGKASRNVSAWLATAAAQTMESGSGRASQQKQEAHVRVGSLADLAKRPRHVRCYPDGRHCSAPLICLLSAISGHCRHLPNGRLWNVGATMTAYSALMLAARITLPHFSVSSAMSLSKSAGEPASAMPPRSARCTFNLRSARPALISLLSFSTTSAGANPRALGWRATGCEHFDWSGHERPRASGAFQ